METLVDTVSCVGKMLVDGLFAWLPLLLRDSCEMWAGTSGCAMWRGGMTAERLHNQLQHPRMQRQVPFNVLVIVCRQSWFTCWSNSVCQWYVICILAQHRVFKAARFGWGEMTSRYAFTPAALLIQFDVVDSGSSVFPHCGMSGSP